MADTRDITLGGRAFAVPRLPLRVNRRVYPLCRKLTIADLFGRTIAEQTALGATEEELDDLCEIAFLAASAADGSLTRPDFDALPVTPGELLDAFIEIRLQTGGWTRKEPGEPEPGEASGGEDPPK